jgi:hypothetical protein
LGWCPGGGGLVLWRGSWGPQSDVSERKTTQMEPLGGRMSTDPNMEVGGDGRWGGQREPCWSRESTGPHSSIHATCQCCPGHGPPWVCTLSHGQAGQLQLCPLPLPLQSHYGQPAEAAGPPLLSQTPTHLSGFPGSRSRRRHLLAEWISSSFTRISLCRARHQS